MLGGLILQPSSLHDLKPLLRPSDFSNPRYQGLYEKALEIGASGGAIDPVTLGDLELATSLASACPVATNILSYARTVRDLSVARSVIGLMSSYSHQLQVEPTSVERVLREARTALAGLEVVESSITRLRVASALQVIEDRLREPNRHVVPSGIGGLDKIIGGFRPEQLVVVAARPGVGKSSLARTVSLRAAQGGVPVLFFSLEMSHQEQVEALLSGMSSIPATDLGRGALDIGSWKTRLQPAAVKLDGLPIWMDERSRSISQILAGSRQWRASNPASEALIVIDYLGLVRSDARVESRSLELGMMTRQFKELAAETKVPVMILSQLNRNVASRDDKRPQLTDLRESGSIEQDANTVIFVDRDVMNGTGPATIYVAKNRGGPTGTLECHFNADTMTFVDLDDPGEVY